MTVINELNAMIINLTTMTEQFGTGQFIAISFFDERGAEIISVLNTLDTSATVDEALSDISELVQRTYMEKAEIDSFTLIILNDDIDKSAEIGNSIIASREFDIFKIIAIVVTDSYRWHDLIAVEGGKVDHSEITDFQLQQIVEGNLLTELD